jgi:hypothetical protein
MGWDFVSELRPPTVLFSSSSWCMGMESHSGIISSQGKAPYSSIRVLWEFYQQSSSSEAEETWRTNTNFACEVPLFIFLVFSNMLKALRHGTDWFTFPPMEVVLWIFIALKTSSSAGFEPTNLGTNCNHAITRPPRATRWCLKLYWQEISRRSTYPKWVQEMESKIWTCLLYNRMHWA